MSPRLLHRAAVLLVASVAIAACSDATDPGQSAAAIQAVSATAVSGSAGQPSAISPTVRVLNADGIPLIGVVVRFRVTAGSGSIQFADVTSTAGGQASAGVWTLGSEIGVQTVTATVDGVTPLVFTTNTGPGPAAEITILTGSGQAAPPGATLPVSLSVRVRDAFNRPIPNQSVSFLISAGGGTIAGGGTATANTDSDGVATVGPWVLGTSPGTNLITAHAGTVNVTFTATALDPCDVQPEISIGTFEGSIVDSDCLVGATRRDNYRFTVTAGQAVLVELTGTFDTFLSLSTTAGVPLARDDNSGDGNNSRLRFIPATSGTVVIGAGAAAPGEIGSYSLTIANTTQASDGCGPPTYLQFGASTAQAVAETDCGDPAADEFWVYIPANTAARIAMASPIDAYLFVTNPEGETVEVDNELPDGTEVYDVAPTATSGGFYFIRATSFGIVFGDVMPELDIGPYTLSVTTPPTSGQSISAEPFSAHSSERRAAAAARKGVK